jgi:hypothetical protein
VLGGAKSAKFVIIPTGLLQAAFPTDYLQVLRKLRDDGILEGESGGQKKLSVKAPRELSTGRARVYRFRLSRLGWRPT